MIKETFFSTDFLKNDEIYLKLIKTTDANSEKGWVPAYHFSICTLSGIEVGECDFRIGFNENLYYGGNIGYSVYKEEKIRAIIDEFYKVKRIKISKIEEKILEYNNLSEFKA